MNRPALVENFLRPPRGAAEITADAVRVLGLVGVVVAFVGWGVTDAGIVALALPALVVPRFLAVRASFDIVYGITVLVAAWSNVLDLYRSLVGWDLLLHLVCTGVLAAMTYIGLARLRVVPAPSAPDFLARTGVIVTLAIGLAYCVIWEIIEWLGKNYVSDDIFVTYDDTIGDMAIGGVGSLVAGFVVARIRLDRRPAHAGAPATPRSSSGAAVTRGR